MTDHIHVMAGLELKRLICEAADADGISVSEWMVRAAAKALNRQDLAAVPRKRPGRPRKTAIAS